MSRSAPGRPGPTGEPARGSRRAPARPLLERRLLIVTGKGGTGKTSVAAALALEASRRGRSVVVVETGRDEHVPRLIEPGGAPVGYAGRELRPGLRVLRVEPFEALAEYLRLQLKVPGLVTRVLRNPGFRQLLDAAPGWRELITLGKVWHLQELGGTAERPPLVIVDAPATGHGLTFLDVPRVVVSAVRTGPLRRHAGWVENMVKHEDDTLLVPVTLAEELPARETAELVKRVREELHVPVDRVVVNALPEAPFPEDLADLDQRLAVAPEPAPAPGLPSIGALARCASHLRSRFELGQEYEARVREWTALPSVCLPFLPAGIHGPADLERLGAGLVGDDPRA